MNNHGTKAPVDAVDEKITAEVAKIAALCAVLAKDRDESVIPELVSATTRKANLVFERAEIIRHHFYGGAEPQTAETI